MCVSDDGWVWGGRVNMVRGGASVSQFLGRSLFVIHTGIFRNSGYYCAVIQANYDIDKCYYHGFEYAYFTNK